MSGGVDREGIRLITHSNVYKPVRQERRESEKQKIKEEIVTVFFDFVGEELRLFRKEANEERSANEEGEEVCSTRATRRELSIDQSGKHNV